MPGTPLVCDDDDPCTVDSCDPTGGCHFDLVDEDGDGYAPTELGACGLDCDDLDETVHPDAVDLPSDQLDQDCDGLELCYADADADGFRSDSIVLSAGLSCQGPGTAPAKAYLDCDDKDPGAHPGATEVPGDRVDQNCDGYELCYIDADEDGYRSNTLVGSTNISCEENGIVSAFADLDCNDNNASIHPGASEVVGDGVDQNCNGQEICYRDADGDGYRTNQTVTSPDASCKKGDGEALVSSFQDCNDNNPSIHPSAPEVPNDGIDSDCDGADD